HEVTKLLLIEDHPLDLEQEQRELNGATLNLRSRYFVTDVHGRLPINASLIVEAHGERRENGETRHDQQHRDTMLRGAPRPPRQHFAVAHGLTRRRVRALAYGLTRRRIRALAHGLTRGLARHLVDTLLAHVWAHSFPRSMRSSINVVA